MWEKIFECLKAAASFIFLLLLIALLVFGVLAELFPRIVPDWYYYFTTPVGIILFIAFFVWLIKNHKKK